MEKVVKKYKLGEEPSDLEFWLTQTPQQRLSALESLRDLYIKLTNNGIKPRLQRVYTVIKRTGRDKDNLDLKNLPEKEK